MVIEEPKPTQVQIKGINLRNIFDDRFLGAMDKAMGRDIYFVNLKLIDLKDDNKGEIISIFHPNKEKMEQEFGDLMFSLINAARLYDINPDNALEKTNQKFIKRFNYLEDNTIKKGLSLKDMSLDEMRAMTDVVIERVYNEENINKPLKK